MLFKTFQKNLIENQTKYGVNKGSEFQNRVLKSWLEKIAIEIISTHNEEKSVAAERLNRTVKNKIYKYMTSISKNVHIDIHQMIQLINATINVIEPLT